MKAIILAAGQGTRLKKYTENLPKGMLMFQGKTIIERQIEIYRKCGINNIIIVSGYASEKISYEDVTYYKNDDYENTNMVESFLCARKEFDEDVILSYSDILFDEAMLRQMMSAKCDFVCAVDTKWQDYWRARYGKVNFDTESLSMDEDSNIIELGKENPNLEDIDARYVGLLKFSKFGLDVIQKIMDRDYTEYQDKPWKQSGKTIRKAYMTDLLQAVIEDGKKVKGERFENGWIEFDTNDDYEIACKWAEEGSLKRFLKGKGE